MKPAWYNGMNASLQRANSVFRFKQQVRRCGFESRHGFKRSDARTPLKWQW